MRIAFLTNEFPDGTAEGGGLAAYLRRMTLLLFGKGHEPEVFVTASELCATRSEQRFGAIVHLVASTPKRRLPLHIRGLLGLSNGLTPLRVAYRAALAWDLARAFQARHAERPFDIVQSSNFGLTGLYLPKLLDCKHVIRCSQTTALCANHGKGSLASRLRGGFSGPSDRLEVAAERRLLHRVDLVYAPAALTAEFYRGQGIDARVLRPPFVLEVEPRASSHALPARYFAFVGKFDRVKGADVLAQAAQLAWEQEPEIELVWAGYGETREFIKLWKNRSKQIHILGKVEKGVAYGVMRGAVATVAPSRVDNLPNTVIESLMLGTGVIGTRGTSIDELVWDGHNGTVVKPGDARALAAALVAAWRCQYPWQAGLEHPSTMKELAPDHAVSNFIDMAQVLARGVPRSDGA